MDWEPSSNRSDDIILPGEESHPKANGLGRVSWRLARQGPRALMSKKCSRDPQSMDW